jgi:hypothetical protein
VAAADRILSLVLSRRISQSRPFGSGARCMSPLIDVVN